MIPGANTTITAYHLKNSGNTTIYDATPFLTGAEAYIENASAEVRVVLGISATAELYTAYADAAEFKLGDKIVDAAGKQYRVNGIKRSEGNQDIDDSDELTLGAAAATHA